jgi:YidC/Oxa1 family membrane protein insertase
MVHLFQTILFQPIFNGFIVLYNIIPDAGAVIFIITIIIKLALYPLTSSSIKAQKALSELQPKLEELKKKHKKDQQQLAQETMKMYKENKVNPLGSCLPLIIQLPVFLALYWVLRDVLVGNKFELIYSFVATPEFINPISLGFFNLGDPNVILALLAGVTQFFQAKMFSRRRAPKKAGEGSKDENMMSMMNKQMLYFMPVMTVFIGLRLPGGLALYWFLSTLFTLVQQMIVFRNEKGTSKKDIVEGTLVE